MITEYCNTTTGYKHHLAKKEKACEPCLRANRAATNRFRMKNPERVRAYSRPSPELARKMHLRNKFGITVEEYQEMYDAQKGLCCICRLPETSIWRGKVIQLAVDHDHQSGKVRSLLCKNCNVGLGAFKDDIVNMYMAIKYLKEHK